VYLDSIQSEMVETGKKETMLVARAVEELQ
jgi:hypothetical protein